MGKYLDTVLHAFVESKDSFSGLCLKSDKIHIFFITKSGII